MLRNDAACTGFSPAIRYCRHTTTRQSEHDLRRRYASRRDAAVRLERGAFCASNRSTITHRSEDEMRGDAA